MARSPHSATRSAASSLPWRAVTRRWPGSPSRPARNSPMPRRSTRWPLGDLPAGVFAAGSINHVHAPAEVLADGMRAGRLGARHAGLAAAEIGPAAQATAGLNHPLPVFRHPKGKEFVDFDEDLTIGDIENAVADGFAHPELLKRWSTAGMGPSQGRHSAVNVLRIAARAQALRPADLGPTGTRPPFTGERFDHLAGQAFHPWRDTPMQRRHEELGARMMVAGLWRRPASYAAGGGGGDRRGGRRRADRRRADRRRRPSARSNCADPTPRPSSTASTSRPTPGNRSAAAATRSSSTMSGSIVDDGVACRFAEDQFYVTATTGQADATYRLLTWFNAQWGMDVDITNLTGAFAAVNIAGPSARPALAPLVEGVDLGAEAFPYLGDTLRQGWRHPGTPPPRRVRRRARLRDPRPGDPGRGPLGSPHRCRPAARHQAIRRRGAAPASPREGARHRRPGYRRVDDAVRSQHGLGGAEDEGRVSRQDGRRNPPGTGIRPPARRLSPQGGRPAAARELPGHRRRRDRRAGDLRRLARQPAAA